MFSYFRQLNFAFFGSPEFAAVVLKRLIENGFIPELVVTNPDRPKGRKKIITPPLVKEKILGLAPEIKNRIKIFQPENLDSKLNFGDFKFDFFLVAAYAQIIPKSVFQMPRLGTIGVHPSLLPKFRGPSPIQSFILSGESETGTTLFLMDEKVDNGPIISQKKLEIDKNELEQINYKTLEKKLAELSADLLIKTLPKFVKDEINLQPQDDSQATYTQKIKIEDAYIKPEYLNKAENQGGKKVLEIWRKIRAFNPEPGTWTLRQAQGKQKRMKILEAVLTPEGKLKLKKIQFEGKNPVFT